MRDKNNYDTKSYRENEILRFLDDEMERLGLAESSAKKERRQQRQQQRIRYLQEESLEPSISPSLTIAPTMFDNGKNKNNSTGSKKNDQSSGSFSIVWWILLVVVILVIGRICYQRFRRRQERLLSDYRSAQADRVLGDMQMVPNADLDDNDDHDIL